MTWVSSLSMLRSSEPPPDMTMPLSMMSELSSGGVCSRTVRTAATSCWSGISIASITSDDVIGIVRGRPAIRSRPRTSIVSSRSSGSAVPIWILTSSAVRSPTIRLYFLRMYEAIDSSNLLPPTRRLLNTTMPPSAMTAISDVPPPMSMIMFPDGPLIGTLAPIAAASGSSIRYASFAPALRAASRTARFSTEVTPAGTEIITSGRLKPIRPLVALPMKNRSIASVMT